MTGKLFNFIMILYFGVLFVYLNNTYPRIILKYSEKFRTIYE
jgi:hypothetical protein